MYVNDHTLARLCRFAYERANLSDQEVIKPTRYCAGYKAIALKDAAEVQGVYLRESKVLLFVGTDTRTDWFRNLWSFHDNGVHMGMRAAWNAIDGQVGAVVGGDTGITICGHSLGGALAQQAFMALPEGTAWRVVTFGQPRQYDLPTAAAYRAAAKGTYQRRYVFWDDPVPWLPFFHWGFAHSVKPTYLPWWPTSVWSRRRHSMGRYIEALERRERYCC